MSLLCLPFSIFFNLRKNSNTKETAEVLPSHTVSPPLYVEKERIPPTIIADTFKKYDDDLRDISLKLHRYHELAFKEFKSAKLLTGFLEKEGFSVKHGIAGDETAFVGTYKQGKGPVVSFNAVLSQYPSTDDGRNMMRCPTLDRHVAII
jgi:hypothetical protein